MKKYFLAVLAIGTFAISQAQDVQFGAKGGFNFAKINGDETDNVDTRTSFHVGAVAEIPLSEQFSFQPEVLYSSQGGKQDDLKLKLDYINVPLMAKYYVADGLSLEAGPQIGFLVNDEVSYDGDEFDADLDLDGSYSSVDFGLNFGLGYKFDSGLFLNGRYNWGLSNILDGDLSDDYDQNNGVFQVGAGFFF